jgi:hypothetical protein
MTSEEGPMAGSYRPDDRPDWVKAIYLPYRRVQRDGFWLSVVATVSIAALIASDRRTWSRRGMSRPGTTVAAVTLLTGGVTALHFFFLTWQDTSRMGLSYDVMNILEYRIPGAVIGAWVVTWLGRRRKRRRPGRDRLGYLVGWIWMANVVLLIAYDVIFC